MLFKFYSIGSSSGARDNVNASHSKENSKSIFTVTVNEWEVGVKTVYEN